MESQKKSYHVQPNLKVHLQNNPKERLILMLKAKTDDFNKPSASSQECIPSLSVDETEGGKTCIFRTKQVSDKMFRKEDLIIDVMSPFIKVTIHSNFAYPNCVEKRKISKKYLN